MPRGGAPIFTSPSYVMRLNVERHISRKQERTHWNLLQKDQPGLVSQFGNLHGIRDIDPPLHLEYVPYTMGRSIVDGGADYFGNAGSTCGMALLRVCRSTPRSTLTSARSKPIRPSST